MSRRGPPGAKTAVVGAEKHSVSVQFEPQAFFGYTRHKVDQVERECDSPVDIKKYSFGRMPCRVHHLLNSCHVLSLGVRETRHIHGEDVHRGTLAFYTKNLHSFGQSWTNYL
ncbi:hypothetical protein TcasGA2_TC014043 [Tribolium castaneum]|uniref:Uncharacterized protein n=1 Tax=Tribolium castaneum TaxID=7070 RepID=D6WJL8_TRICA|nr:hypothetical protein TcasGA2_TC014043 [Tribolium castaneum]